MRQYIPKISFNYLLVGLFAIGYAIFFIAMPKYVDDIRFLLNIYPWFEENGVTNINEGVNVLRHGLPWQQIIETWQIQWLTDNLRLGNVLDIVFLVFPKWIGSGIVSLIWFYCIVQSYKIACVDIRKSPLVILAMLLWVVFLPWGWMGTLVLQFNYILPTGLALWIMGKSSFCPQKKQSMVDPDTNIKILVSFISGFLLGWWHEAFSLSFAAGVIALILTFKDQRKSSNYFILLGLLLGTAFIAIAPGTEERFNVQVAYTSERIRENLRNIFEFNIPFYILLALGLYLSVKNGIKSLTADRFFIFCLTNAFANIAISFATYTLPRVTWWTQIVSVLGIIYLLQRYGVLYWRKYKFVNLIWLIPGIIIVFIHLISIDIVSVKINRAVNRAIDNYVKSPDKSVFSDVITLREMPFTAGMLPEDYMFDPLFCMDYSQLLSKNDGNPFVIIPEELKNVTSQSGVGMEGQPGLRKYNGRLFIEADSVDLSPCSVLSMEADYGKGYVHIIGYSFLFRSEADNKTYYYIQDRAPWYVAHFKKLKGLKINSEIK